MKKKTPNLVLTNYSLRGVLDTLFNSKVQEILYTETFNSIKKALQEKKRECVVCDIGQLETNSVLVADAVWKSNPILFVA
jgi:hypothetical protein